MDRRRHGAAGLAAARGDPRSPRLAAAIPGGAGARAYRRRAANPGREPPGLDRPAGGAGAQSASLRRRRAAGGSRGRGGRGDGGDPCRPGSTAPRDRDRARAWRHRRLHSGRFARRTTWLAALGGGIGALAALPLLLGLARLAAPFADGNATDIAAHGLPELSALLWVGLSVLPLAAAAIGFVTAQATVRGWLRRLP